VPSTPKPSAKNEPGEFDRFTDFMRRLVAVPHSEIKAKLDAEKLIKEQKRKSKASKSSASGHASRDKG
jgi:hypothetical protein